MKKLMIAVVLGGVALGTPIPRALAQTPDKLVFHAESDQVLVPTFVYDKTLITLLPQMRPRDTRNLWNWNHGEISDLSSKVFHLFEDGKEQKIQNVTARRWFAHMDVYDNVSNHVEYSDTPIGKWKGPDLGPNWGPVFEVHLYLIAYAPPPSAQGSCHLIEVKVDRPNSFVLARSQYCNTKHSPNDPLNGTKFGQQMEGDAASRRAGKINLSLQTGSFYTDTDALRVNIALEFPWKTLKHEWRDVGTVHSAYATIGILGMVYRKDGTLAARFSGLGCCSPDLPLFLWGGLSLGYAYSDFDPAYIPTAYEAQIQLPPGEYNLQVLLSDGAKFGRVRVPLTVDRYDRKQLAVSSIVLCKRFRNAAASTPEASVDDFASQYVPLVSNGVEFTPAGDTRFKKGDALFAYFEVYEPPLDGQPAATVQSQLKVTNVKTGELKVDTGARTAATWIQPGSSVIRIAEELSVEKLPAGSYRLEVQASDSAGKSTVWRAAEFTVE